MMECLDYEQRLKICEGLLRPQHRTDDKRSSSCRCIYLMLTWCVLSTLLLAASSGYILYGFIRIDGPLGDRHWWRFYDGHERLVGPDRASWCFWNRSKETGRIIVNSLVPDLKKEAVDNSFHVNYYEPDSDVYGTANINPETPTPIVTWFQDGIGCRIGASIQYDKRRGQFQIARSGNYILYSHMTFQPPPHIVYRRQRDGKGLEFTFEHVVGAKRRGEEREVLKDRITVTCPTVQRYGGRPHPCHVADQAAILWLEAGDQLKVKAAPIQYVLGDLKSSYFGCVLLN